MDPQSILKNFYTTQKEKWADSPYSKEDIEKNFTEEHLSSLSLEEYVLLMKRFSAQMVTHVTRQGIRDHLGGVNHLDGEGKYWSGFTDTIEDGFQKSSLEIFIGQQEKREAIKKYLNLESGLTLEQVEIAIRGLTDDNLQKDDGSFADRISIHFATEEVADAHYGAEKGNEIFFAYPSAFIASQFIFRGQLNKADGGTHNNQWVWPEEGSGISINAGLIFIPEDARVNKDNGSRYELNTELEPTFNTKLEAQLMNLIKAPDFENYISNVYQELSITNIDINKLWENCSLYQVGEIDLQNKLKGWVEELKSRFGVTDEKTQKLILTYGFSSFAVHSPKEGDPKKVSESLRSILSDEGIGLTPSKETISSKEYWENYFTQNPSKRPSKIVYYEGGDPSKALQDWKRKNGLSIKDRSEDMGFGENRLDLEKQPEQITSRASRFYNLAMDVANEYFDEKEKTG